MPAPLEETPAEASETEAPAPAEVEAVEASETAEPCAANEEPMPLPDEYGDEVKARDADFEEGVGVKFMVGVDGSDISLKAWKTAVHMMQKGDMLVVYHCSNPGRYKEKAASFDPGVIKSNFETQAIKADIAFKYRIDYVFEDKQSPSDKIRDKIIKHSTENHVDVLVLGSYGSKGCTNSKYGADRVGSSAFEAVRNSKCTTVLVKPSTQVPDVTEPGNDERASFLCGVDGSDIAHQGFLQAAHLCQRADRLVTLTLGESIPSRSSKVPLCFRPEVIQERYSEELQIMGFEDSEAVLERCPPGMSVPTKFIKAAEEKEITFLVFGSKGLSGSSATLGSVANMCIKKAPCGVVVIKLSSRDLRPAESLERKGTD